MNTHYKRHEALTSLDRKAFSTIEMLMAIALIGLLALAAIGPDNSIFSGIGDEPLNETLRLAIRETRYQSVNLGEPLCLHWDEATRSFVILTFLNDEVQRIQSDALGQNDSLVFQCIKQNEEVGEAPGTDHIVEVPDMIFDADRCCTPIIAAIQYAGEKMTVRYDAFSNLKMEEDGK